ncbi:MAG TPA: hypothetical protein VLE91_02030, partial [Candidatus Saccharimonadales bacterium]|nr:hypothetical protein [Candidatus Saccharimonadales bacterium]
MALALYIKEDTAKKVKVKKIKDRTFFGLISVVGLAAVVFAAIPFVTWQLKTLPKLTSKVEKAPIPTASVLSQKTALEA